ncbi:hypothetical protein [Streptomyces sp. S1D4-20]|uniref:hypothetical protein n=1 Tax=Streptomyces sp. S1D4-20 TaxID=2594462 RepID=UPI00116502D2|nr:hypothetical protein [Streptomyces sp. S1D4-20]QDN55037.1 hypothetical protein FNV67_06415 [Streptomyces sp. S1D4-20]
MRQRAGEGGFCQVVSRPPNPASATAPGRSMARWIGGSAGQAAGRTTRAPAPRPAPPAVDVSLTPASVPSAEAEAPAAPEADAAA